MTVQFAASCCTAAARSSLLHAACGMHPRAAEISCFRFPPTLTPFKRVLPSGTTAHDPRSGETSLYAVANPVPGCSNDAQLASLRQSRPARAPMESSAAHVLATRGCRTACATAPPAEGHYVPRRMAETDNPCIDFASDNLIGLRVGGLFGILAVSCIGVMIPIFSYRSRFSHTYFFVRAFASGEQRSRPALPSHCSAICADCADGM